MKLTIKKDTPYVFDGANDFLDKKIHLVCRAVNSLTICGTYLEAVAGISTAEVNKYVNTVNKKNEVGNLYPNYSMTLFPLSIYEQRNDFRKIDVFEKHIIDCFDSNEKYIKCSKLIFLLEREYDIDIDTIFLVLKKQIRKYNFIYTKEIIFYLSTFEE